MRTYVQLRAGRLDNVKGEVVRERPLTVLVAEDVGRHTAVDKVQGVALQRSIRTADRILLSTGRVSAEMLLKAARMAEQGLALPEAS